MIFLNRTNVQIRTLDGTFTIILFTTLELFYVFLLKALTYNLPT